VHFDTPNGMASEEQEAHFEVGHILINKKLPSVPDEGTGGAVGVQPTITWPPCGCAALLFKWLLNAYGYNDAGTIGALFMGVLTNLAWKKGWPNRLSMGPSADFAADAERFLGLFWKWIAQPLLFGAIGSG
jgi:hypothetical protein